MTALLAWLRSMRCAFGHRLVASRVRESRGGSFRIVWKCARCGVVP